MAASEILSEGGKLSLDSYQTAVCVVPPTHSSHEINHLRQLYDKSFRSWPPHINIIYPFVATKNLSQAVELMQSELLKLPSKLEHGNLHLRLDRSSHFSHRHSSTVFIAPSDTQSTQSLKKLRSAILKPFRKTDNAYNPHLTIGQSKAYNSASRENLLAKASLLLPIEWSVEELVVLVRIPIHGDGVVSSRMEIWGTIQLSRNITVSPVAAGPIHGEPHHGLGRPNKEEGRKFGSHPTSLHQSQQPLSARAEYAAPHKTPIAQPGVTYKFFVEASVWEPVGASNPSPSKEMIPKGLMVSSYNVLADPIRSPALDRYPSLLRNLVSEFALADILVLQEVTDDFLCFLLANDTIQAQYNFSTHPPPDQLGISPLPSLRNIVVLSRWKFTWEWLPFEMRHKGSVILTFESIGSRKDSRFLPLTVAGVHLAAGLNDDTMVTKAAQLQVLLAHLSKNHPASPWIVAGDFNLTTSALTIDAALTSKAISPDTVDVIWDFEATLRDAGLVDSWLVTGTDIGDTGSGVEDPNEGEAGATFNPLRNSLAAETVKRGISNRPQRYDRILFRKDDLTTATAFNMFGLLENSGRLGKSRFQHVNIEENCGSDHWGIRASLRIDSQSEAEQSQDVEAQDSHPPELRRAPPSLSNHNALQVCLAEHSILPDSEEINKRMKVFELVKTILHQTPHESSDAPGNISSKAIVMVVPVGSYALDVWSTSSDIDCLCIGSISTESFFAGASRRLQSAAGSGIRILRKVEAASGTMMELDVSGIKFDLQYCPAAEFAESWPEIVQTLPLNPKIDLTLLALRKFNSYRDFEYLQRSIPDLVAFRTARRFIRAWAKRRGIYSSKLAYLGGTHINLMLSRICKLIAGNARTMTAADVICAFFHHYAHFSWKTQMVSDPVLYEQRQQYHRSAREPMVILSLFPPTLNVAQTATLPTLRVMIEELKLADSLLSEREMTWSKFLGDIPKEGESRTSTGDAFKFLNFYASYIRIEVHYWGSSSSKANTFVGWLESRLPLLLVNLSQRLPQVHARLWPTRFTSDNDNNNKEQGCYLVGLAKGEPGPDRKAVRGTVQAALNRFADQIRGDQKYYDPELSWVDAMLIKKSELGDLEPDDREWGDRFINEELLGDRHDRD